MRVIKGKLPDKFKDVKSSGKLINYPEHLTHINKEKYKNRKGLIGVIIKFGPPRNITKVFNSKEDLEKYFKNKKKGYILKSPQFDTKEKVQRWINKKIYRNKKLIFFDGYNTVTK